MTDEAGAEGTALDAYLARIDAVGLPDSRPGYDLLATLQARHLRAVPFENLDIVAGEDIVLDRERIAEKVIDRERGGFCYELNGLFEWLLSELGFETTMVSGRVAREDGTLGPPYDHLATVVALDDDYLVDVGFGDFARRPLPLDGDPVSDVGGTFRVRKDDGGNSDDVDSNGTGSDETDRYRAESWTDDGWTTEYVFTTRPREFEEFAETCRFHQTSPESPFTDGPFATVATPDGRTTLGTSTLAVTEHGRKHEYPVPSADERERILRERFDIELL
jgi:N-hydroxyarylamine O-acetyltransferase